MSTVNRVVNRGVLGSGVEFCRRHFVVDLNPSNASPPNPTGFELANEVKRRDPAILMALYTQNMLGRARVPFLRAPL
nr:hypothetical protein Iba_chr04cCG12660 [Ipomoea batatas]